MEYFVNLTMLLYESERFFLSEDEKKVYDQEAQARVENSFGGKSNMPRFSKNTIGEYFSTRAKDYWLNEKNACIRMMLAYIESDGSWHDDLITGFIAAWANSEIQHPVLDRLVKHTLNNNLLEYPLNTTMSDYFLAVNKKPNHAPKKDVIEYLPTLMTYFEVRTINGTGKQLGIDNKTVREHLAKLVGNDYKVLIDEGSHYYKKIKEVHAKWILNKK